MAGVKISALPAIVTPQLTDVYPVSQSGTTFKIAGSQIVTLFSGSFLPLAGGTMTGNIIMNGANIQFSSGQGLVDANAAAALTITTTLAAVNFVSLVPSATGVPVHLVLGGTDANIQFVITGKGTGGVVINGTGTNDNAPTGYVGEFISQEVLVASAVSVLTATGTDITSISLTAGDWDLEGNACCNPASGTTMTSFGAYISTVSSTAPTAPNKGAYNSVNGISAVGSSNFCLVTGRIRISIAATTTVYLGTFTDFSGSTMKAYGYISARRVR